MTTKIELSNGKYTVTHDNGRGLRALRYGEEWRDLAGDGLVLAMCSEIERLQAEVERLRERDKRVEDLLMEVRYELVDMRLAETDIFSAVDEYLFGGDDE